MKAVILSVSFLLLVHVVHAQQAPVNTLPPGKYEVVNAVSATQWHLGDVQLLPENKYKLSSSDEVGEYKFSVTAQRIFFTSGPLKSMYARTISSNAGPAIFFHAS